MMMLLRFTHVIYFSKNLIQRQMSELPLSISKYLDYHPTLY